MNTIAAAISNAFEFAFRIVEDNPDTTIALIAALSAAVSARMAHLVYRDSCTPYIVVYTECKNRIVYLVVENIGEAPALDVAMVIDGGNLSPVPQLQSKIDESFVGKGLKVLMPGSYRTTALAQASDYIGEEYENRAAHVEYRKARRFPGANTEIISLSIFNRSKERCTWTTPE